MIYVVPSWQTDGRTVIAFISEKGSSRQSNPVHVMWHKEVMSHFLSFSPKYENKHTWPVSGPGRFICGEKPKQEGWRAPRPGWRFWRIEKSIVRTRNRNIIPLYSRTHKDWTIRTVKHSCWAVKLPFRIGTLRTRSSAGTDCLYFPRRPQEKWSLNNRENFTALLQVKYNIKYIVQSYIALYFIRLYNYTLHLFKDQPEDGIKTGPRHVAAIIIQ